MKKDMIVLIVIVMFTCCMCIPGACDPHFWAEILTKEGILEVDIYLGSQRVPSFDVKEKCNKLWLYNKEENLVVYAQCTGGDNCISWLMPEEELCFVQGDCYDTGCDDPAPSSYYCKSTLLDYTPTEMLGNYRLEIERADGERTIITYIEKGKCLSQYNNYTKDRDGGPLPYIEDLPFPDGGV